MRLTSEFWLTAFIRQVRSQGGFAYLLRKGAEEAGAIFIRQLLPDSRIALYGPAPQIFYDENIARGDRLFILLHTANEEEINAQLINEQQFDPDIWVVEIENLDKLEQIGQFKLIEKNGL